MFRVLMDTTSADNIPDGVAGGIEFSTIDFVFGIVVGIIITFSIIGIVKYVKFLIKDNKEMKERLNSQKSDD